MTTPDHSITFALTAYGQWLVHRHGLAMRLQASLFPDHPVWSEQCFVLVRSDELGPAARDITTVRLEHPSAIRLLDRAIVLKSLATVLRFAYLADAPLRRVTWQPPPSAAGTPRLQATLFDSSILELREIAPGDAHGHVLMRQSGDPDRWFDTDRWSVLAPLLRQQRGAETASHQRRLPRALAALLHPLTAARLGGVPVLPPPAPRSGEIPTALPEREPHVARADTPAPLR